MQEPYNWQPKPLPKNYLKMCKTFSRVLLYALSMHISAHDPRKVAFCRYNKSIFHFHL